MTRHDAIDDGDHDEDPLPSDQDSHDDPDTVPCPFCGAEMSETADVCPDCGSFVERESEPRLNRFWWWVAVTTLVLCVLTGALWSFR